MKFGTTKDGVVCAIVEGDRVVALDGTYGPKIDSVQDIISGLAAETLDLSDVERIERHTLPLVQEIAWAAPIPQPRRNILCVGKNYVDHAKEFAGSGFDSSSQQGDDIPKHPIIFTKAPETVVGPDALIEVPLGLSEQLDY